MLAIYTRLSREDDDSNSIDNQIREGKEFAADKNFQFKLFNEGEGISGTQNIKERPQLSSLINEMRLGNINHVWMRNQNRLSRDVVTFGLFCQTAKKHNVDLFFGKGEKLDLNNPTSMLNVSILSTLNQYQAHLQSFQTKKSLQDNAKEGKAWGVIPYGYMTDDQMKIIINDSEAEVVKKIFNLSLQGWGVRRIATYLDEQNIPTRYNGYEGEIKIKNRYNQKVTKRKKKDIVWSPKTVLDILKNQWYIGRRIYSGIEYPTPTIISKDLFDMVGLNIVKNRHNSGKKVEYRYLLKGLIVCGKCGRNYYGRTRQSKKDNFYMCSSKRKAKTNCGNRSISIPHLETFVIKHLFGSRDLLDILKSINANDNSLNSLKKELEEDRIKLEQSQKKQRRIADLVEMPEFQLDQMIIEDYLKARNAVSSLKARIEAKKRRIEEFDNKETTQLYEEKLASIDLSNFTKLKEAINVIVKEIEVLYYNKSFSSTENLHSGIFGPGFFTVNMKYHGFTEVISFKTSPPYREWVYGGRHHKIPFQEDGKIDLTQKADAVYKAIYLKKEELIHFN